MWCADAYAYLESKCLDFELIDARSDPRRMDELAAANDQTKTPPFIHDDFVVAAFVIEKFEATLAQHPET